MTMPKVKSYEPSVQNHVSSYSDQAEFQTLLEAHKFLQKELERTKARIAIADQSRMELDEAVSQVSIKAKVIASQTPPPMTLPVANNAAGGGGGGTGGTKRKKSSSGGGGGKKKS